MRLPAVAPLDREALLREIRQWTRRANTHDPR